MAPALGVESEPDTVTRRVPPPDFRYVWLMPGPTSLGAVIAGVGAAITATGAALWTSGHHPATAGVMAAGAALCAGALAGVNRRRLRSPARARPVAMAIVPWGVLVEPDSDVHVLRWPAVRKVDVDVSHTMEGGTPAVLSSTVTIDTGRELLTGRAFGAVGLEGLMANLEAYAAEAARPVALDLEGNEPAGDGATEPVVAELLSRAEELCAPRRGAVCLDLPSVSYRSSARVGAGRETLALLRGVLASSGDSGPADPRALAAVIAVRLGVAALVPELLRLGSSPHPVVAAVAKAAAIRLGAGISRAGAVTEVASFLFEEDCALLERWAQAL